MRADEYQRRLASSTVPLPDPARSPESEIFISFPQLVEHGVDYSRVHLRRLVEGGLFPRPVLLSANRIAWKWDVRAGGLEGKPTPVVES